MAAWANATEGTQHRSLHYQLRCGEGLQGPTAVGPSERIYHTARCDGPNTPGIMEMTMTHGAQTGTCDCRHSAMGGRS